MPTLLDVLSLSAGYNTSVVALGTAALGAAGGLAGTFALLRKRALLADAMAHGTLPGICVAFILAALLGGGGKSLPLLLLGAAISAGLGALAVLWLGRATRLPEDAAIGAVLASSYGLGIVLLSVVQNMRTGGQAGLETFLLGSTAGMLLGEALTIGIAAAAVAVVILLMFKELAVVAIDPVWGAAHGWNSGRLDRLLLGIVLAVVVIGLQTVGLVLVLALLVIPPVAARFWTDRLGPLALIAASIGAVGSYFGAGLSALAPGLPTGSFIVLTLAAMFLVSFLAAPGRGLVAVAAARLRAALRLHERRALSRQARGDRLARASRWLLRRRGWLDREGLTPSGRATARRLDRDDALWKRYLELAPDEAVANPGFGRRWIEESVTPTRLADLVA